MKKGYTIIEVSILCVIFIIAAILIVPLSLDDTLQAKNTSRWRNVQGDFVNIFYSVNTLKGKENLSFKDAFNKVISTDIKDSAKNYRITFLNGTYPNDTYRFKEFNTTYSNATLAIKLFDEPQDGLQGLLMYDVNGRKGPNVWGKDVFGMNIYEDRFEPFGKSDSISIQKQDCSKNGTGLSCSNYCLLGGSFE